MMSGFTLVVIRGDVNYVAIGARTNIHRMAAFSRNPQVSIQSNNGNPLIIGEDVTVGHKVMLHGCTIGNRVLVGMGPLCWMAR